LGVLAIASSSMLLFFDFEKQESKDKEIEDE